MTMFNKNYALLTIAICIATISLPAHAWRGGGGGGRGVAYGSRGGSAAWSHGSGVAYGPRGGSAAWSHGAGVAYGPHGGSAAWNNRGGYYGGGYRAPVAYGYRGGAYYDNGYSGGQVAGAAVAGLAVGAMVGASVANSNNQYSTTTVVVQQPVMAIGTNLSYLPSGCINTYVNGIQYFQCSSGWMRYYGNYYQVVPRPY